MGYHHCMTYSLAGTRKREGERKVIGFLITAVVQEREETGEGKVCGLSVY